MGTLIFDIETVGDEWESFDEITKAGLTRWIDRSATDDLTKSLQLKDLKENLGFSPLTGKVVAIGLYDLERRQGAVYYTGEAEEDEEVGEYVLKVRSEKEMLEDFWEGAKSYDTFVTFNGRCFDVPFLLHRSVAHNIKPTVDLMLNRYLNLQKQHRHIDLQDQLTFYGAMYRKPSLHLFCRAFGIVSPKVQGVSGDDVAGLFKQKKYLEIARYNVGDVVATTELYQKWLEYLAPIDYLNDYID